MLLERALAFLIEHSALTQCSILMLPLASLSCPRQCRQGSIGGRNRHDGKGRPRRPHCWGMKADMEPTAGFPGTTYEGQGKSLDLTVPDLLQEQLDDYPHRSIITDRDVAPVARVWLLANGATLDAIPSMTISETVRLVLAGEGILVLAQQPEPEVDVRTGLL